MNNNPKPRRARTTKGRRSNINLTNAIIKANSTTNPEPPMFQSSHHYVQRLRFLCTSSVVNYPILNSDIANLLMVVTQLTEAPPGTIMATPIWTRFKLKRVEMWATATALTTPAQLQITMTPTSSGNSNNTEQTVSDIAKSIDQYAYVKIKPKVTSSAGQWQNVLNNGAQMTLSCPQGTILDLTLHVYLNNNDGFSIQTIWNENTNLTEGTVICNFLDGSTTQAGYFQPIGINNPGVGNDPTPRV